MLRIAPSQLTIREIIGQLMMPMLPDAPFLADADTWRKVEEDLERFSFGGYIVFRGTKDKLPEYLSELQDLSEVPLLIGSDLERGAGQQLAGYTDFPAAMALGAARDPDLAYQQGAITALEARQAGIQWLFAPVLDLVSHPDNPIINVRGMGDDPRHVAYMGAAFIEGAQRYNTLACGKHFPGHAETTVDSHHELPILEVSRHRLEMYDLVPFRHCIAAGMKSVMVGHVAVPAIEEANVPACMSKRLVTDLLREQMSFKGLVVTDALMMGAITERYDPGQAAVRALQAGVDVLLMPPDPQAVVDAVLRSIEEGGLTKQRLLESVERIYEAKLALGLWKYEWEEDEEAAVKLPDYEPAVTAIAEASITLVQATEDLLPLKPESRVVAVVLDDDNDAEAQAGWTEAIGRFEGVKSIVLTGESEAAEIERAIAACAGADVVLMPLVMQVRAWKNRVIFAEPLASVPRQIHDLGKPIVALSFTSPFLIRQFPFVEGFVCAYSPNPLSQRAMVDAVFGRLPFNGRLPVDFTVSTP
jgi:beta-N-acetylhexosaminidase